MEANLEAGGPPAPGWADRAAARDQLIAAALTEHPDWYGSKVRARLVETAGGCWEWTGSRATRGYGRLQLPGRGPTVLAHRVVYLAERGEIGYGLSLDHLCSNPPCANPDHVEPVSLRTNTLRGTSACAERARRTHCPEGHPLELGNLRTAELRRGGRACLACDRQWHAERSATIVAAARYLGMTRRGYVARYGHSRRVAAAIVGGADPATFALPPDPARQSAADRSREADRQRDAERKAAIVAAARYLGLTRDAYTARYGWSSATAEAIVCGAAPAADPGEAA
jgi:hypothetical protein